MVPRCIPRDCGRNRQRRCARWAEPARSPRSRRLAARDSRAAIKRADFQRAESLIGDAEKLGVKYDPLMDRWSDTPDSMRKLLAAERSKATAARPGLRIPALLGGNSRQQPGRDSERSHGVAIAAG